MAGRKGASKGRAAGRARGVAVARRSRDVPEIDADRVFEILRDSILDQRLPPGMQLKEQPLADAFKVNRAVIRQALAKLETYCLASHRPNRGVFVASPSVTEGREIFAARRYIESAIIDLLVASRTPAALDVLKVHVVREQQAYAAGDVRNALRLSIDFHRELARLAGNRVLASFLEELVARTPLVMLSYKSLDSPACTQTEHEEIVTAIERGDAETAKRLMCDHIAHLEERLEPGFNAAGGGAQDGGIAALLGIAS